MKKPTESGAIDIAAVQSRMLTIRNQQVLLDRDVAALYGVQTKEINQAIRNNPGKFPEGFVFQLNEDEFENWKSKILTSNLSAREIAVIKMGIRRAPYALTERGLYMLATILKGEVATRATLAIVNTYAQVRSMVRDMEAIQKEKAGSPEQANLLTRAGHKLAGLIGDNLSTVSRKTTIELNLALAAELPRLDLHVGGDALRRQPLHRLQSAEIRAALQPARVPRHPRAARRVAAFNRGILAWHRRR